jgi:para-nitrobenzyl esterase
MVFIHGGSLRNGSSAVPTYDGYAFARDGVVLVSVNYRLGVEGFAVFPDAPANRGLLDQVAALHWVRDNIRVFGGDPDRVTVFGESAGGMSVADLLVMPSARGLFRRAIVQSGPPSAVGMERAEVVTAKLVAELGIASSAALREVPVGRLLDVQGALVAERRAAGLPLVPVVDGVSIPVPPEQALADGVAAGVDVLIGTNRDEAKMWMVADPANRDPDEAVLRRRIDAIFRANDVEISPDDAIDAYRNARAGRGDDASPREVWSAIQTDRMFRVGSIRAAEAQAPHAPTYMYQFTATSPAMGGALGSCHALEIPYALGTYGSPGMDRFAGSGPDVERLSAQMMDAWLAFARTGDPAHVGIPAWPAYDTEQRATMVFGADTHVENAPYEDERRFWA